MNKSIIAGATGLVGTKLLRALEAKGDQVVVLARRPIPDLAENTRWVQTDFDGLVLGGNLPPCNHVYICLGTTMAKAGSKDAFWKVDFEYCLAVAKRAREAGATTLSLISSVGADAASKNFYLHTKGSLENAIATLDFPRVNIYRPGLLLGNRTERRPLEALGIILFGAISPLLVGSLQKYRGIDVELLASSMVENANDTRTPEGINYFHFRDIRRR
ncbi:MAG: NAD-dependent epimerase/dehydratase family protein [Proteobacteria bacterium]|nr:NAD-dependent epimerase/dehydratase family protein [Pseudomonadota bacterium]MDA1285855.1 NAD-dependent epimerase/dehydratase family protein [Pseudomonadota bacterium]